MDKEKFWALIDKARGSVSSWEDMAAPLTDELAQLDKKDILRWYQILSLYQKLSYKNKLWAAAYVINGGCSDDGFDYFRGWLTAQGKEVFLNALKNPDSLANTDICEDDVTFEYILYAAYHAYCKKTNVEDSDEFYNELDKYPLPKEEENAIKSEIQYASDIDANWDEDDSKMMYKLLPKLCDIYEW